MIDFGYLMGICAVLFGATIWMLKPVLGTINPKKERWLIVILIGCSLLSLAHYTEYGNLHSVPKYGSQNYNPFDAYIYYMGSKYFKETGYFDLYACTSVAIREMKSEIPPQPTPNIHPIMNLKDKRSYLSPAEIWTRYRPICHQEFSPQRWDSFKQDLHTFFNIAAYDDWWRTILDDAGYNSSPIFVAITGPIANVLPISHIWKYIGYLDFFLLTISAVLVYRSFGLYPVLAFLLIFGSNAMSPYSWIGGSYFRYAWFAALAIALCLLKDKRYFWAGVFFAYSTGDRIFPLLFYIGALVPLIDEWIKSKGKNRELVPFINGFMLCTCLLFLLSLYLYGVHSWQDFFANMKNHNRPYWIPHIGLKKVLTYYVGIDSVNFSFTTKGMAVFNQWSDHLAYILNSKRILYYSLTLFMTIGSMWVSRKKSPCFAALLVGGVLLYALFLPARYYYVYLALFPVAIYELPSSVYNNVRLILSFFLIFILLIIPMLPPDDILLGIQFSCALGAFFILEILNGLCEGFSFLNRSRE